jgi:hypothetical protein
MQPLFRLDYHRDEKILKFEEKFPPCHLKKPLNLKLSLFDPISSISQVKWNRNFNHANLIASAGAGWIRIDDLYKKS